MKKLQSVFKTKSLTTGLVLLASTSAMSATKSTTSTNKSDVVEDTATYSSASPSFENRTKPSITMSPFFGMAMVGGSTETTSTGEDGVARTQITDISGGMGTTAGMYVQVSKNKFGIESGLQAQRFVMQNSGNQMLGYAAKLPLHATFRPNNNFCIRGGGYYTRGLGSLKIINNATDTAAEISEVRSYEAEKFNRNDLGLTLGAGLQVLSNNAATVTPVQINASYSWGLNNRSSVEKTRLTTGTFELSGCVCCIIYNF